MVLINSSKGSTIKLIKLSNDNITLELGFDIIYPKGPVHQNCIIDFGLGARRAQLFSIKGGVGDYISMKLLMKSLSKDKMDNLSSVTEAVGQMKVQSTSSDRRSVPKLDTSITQEMPEFKLLLVGGGETTAGFMSGFLSNFSFEKKKYVANLGVEIHPLVFHTNRGPKSLMCGLILIKRMDSVIIVISKDNVRLFYLMLLPVSHILVFLICIGI